MASSHALTLGQRSYPVVLPSVRDPRLHVAAVIISIHVLGQVALGFRVTVPQILAAIVTCAVIEVALTFRKTGMFVWPASAMLTGSGVALILRTTDTTAGDPWGTNDWYVFAVVAGLALLTKYVIQYRGSHVFNPSNVGLVVAFLVLGLERVQPLDFYWGPLDGWLALAYLLIIGGGMLVTRRLNLLAMAATYWLTLAIGTAILAGSGHCMTADWAFGPVCGSDFWRTIVISPEVLIFLFFMLTDPKTIPAGRMATDRLRPGGRHRERAAHGAPDDRVGDEGRLAGKPRHHVRHPAGLRSLPARSPLGGRSARPLPLSAHGLRRSWRHGRCARPLDWAWRGRSSSSSALGSCSPARPPAASPARAASSTSTRRRPIDPASLPTVAIDPGVTSWNAERVKTGGARAGPHTGAEPGGREPGGAAR